MENWGRSSLWHTELEHLHGDGDEILWVGLVFIKNGWRPEPEVHPH